MDDPLVEHRNILLVDVEGESNRCSETRITEVRRLRVASNAWMRAYDNAVLRHARE